jgi:hypothetical protein
MSGVSRVAQVFDDLVFRVMGKLIARQFVVFGGVPAVLARGLTLASKGVTPTYNRIDEHVHDSGQIDAICASYIELVLKMDELNRGNVAIKPSAFGMALGPEHFAQTLTRFTQAIAGKSLEIEIDAEARETLVDVQKVLNALVPMLPPGIHFRPAFQMHLPNEFRWALIMRHRIFDMPLRIVKGSGLYNVGESEVSSEEVLTRYRDTFLKQLRDGKHPNVAVVRDREMVMSLAMIAATGGFSPDTFTIQFLDGVFGRRLLRECIKGNYRTGCYVTFVDPGAPDEWKGYVRRRIAFGRKLMFGG